MTALVIVATASTSLPGPAFFRAATGSGLAREPSFGFLNNDYVQGFAVLALFEPPITSVNLATAGNGPLAAGVFW